MSVNLIMISGSSCSGCTNLHSELNEVIKQFPNMHYEEFSIDQKSEEVKQLVEQYQIEKIPTLLLLKDGVKVGAVSGYQPAEILQYWLEDKLK